MANFAQQDEEQTFPRGGASSITPLKRRQIRAEAQADAERDFFASPTADTGKKRRRQNRRVGGPQVQFFLELLMIAVLDRALMGQ